MTTHRLSYSHAFRRWYGKPLTRTEETLVSHLERQRHSQGRVRAVISVPEAEQAVAENILLHYTLYLHRRFWPWCETMVVDTGTARTRRMIKDDSIVYRPGSRNGGTRGFGTFHHVIGLRMDRYGISLKGDPRGWDAIANLRNSVPDVPNTCVLLVGTYRKRSWRAFSSTYRARLQNNNPDHPYICLDVAALPPMQALPVITRTDWLRLARTPRRPAQPAPRRRLHQVSRGLRRPQADLPADTSPHKPQPAAWRVAHSTHGSRTRNAGGVASVSKPHAPTAGRYVGSYGHPSGTTSETLSPVSKAVTSISHRRRPQSAGGAILRLTGCEAARGRAPGKRTDGSQPGTGDPVVMDWPKPSAWQLAPAGISLGRPQIADAFEQPTAPRRPQRTRQTRIASRRNAAGVASMSKPHAPAAGRYVGAHGHPSGTTSETLNPIREAVTSAPLPSQPAPRRGLHQVSRGLRRPQADLPADTSPRKPQPTAWQVAHSPQSAGGACHSTTPCEGRRRRTSSGSDTIPGTRHKPRQRAQSRPRRQPRPAKPPSTPLTTLNSLNSLNSFNFLSLLTFRPFVPEKPPKLSTHAAAAAAA